ncbi:MAG: flagellar biosynthesis protein FliQ [Acetobacteraceae bacterium]
MNESDIAGLIHAGMLATLKIGGPLMLIGLAVGLIVSILQAVTQINEATLSFVPKVLALGAAAMFLGPFMFATLSAYTRLLFDRIASSGP